MEFKNSVVLTKITPIFPTVKLSRTRRRIVSKDTSPILLFDLRKEPGFGLPQWDAQPKLLSVSDSTNQNAADESLPYLRLQPTPETRIKLIGRIDTPQVNPEVLLRSVPLNLFPLFVPQIPKVRQHRGEPVAESSCHLRVHPTADRPRSPIRRFCCFPFPPGLLLHRVVWHTARIDATYVYDEIPQQLSTFRRVGDLWVELNAVYRVRIVRDGRGLGVLGRCYCVEAFGELGQSVTVRHPCLHGALNAVEERVEASVGDLGRDFRKGVLPGDSGHDIGTV